MSRKLKPLKNIYLQNYFEDFDFYDEGVTWCEDKQNDNDIEYILQSEFDALRAENERLKGVLREIVSPFESYDDAFIYGNIKSKNSNIDEYKRMCARFVRIAQQALNEVKE